MREPATCERCGSTRVRHARTRTIVQRAVRAWTEWDRYACGDCGHRGWRKGKLPRRERKAPTRTIAAPGRRAEQRDARLRRRRFLKQVATITVGLALGLVVAYFVLRIASVPPPPPE